jgi:D-3-phosphoglycerate dehydrogenase
MEANTCILITDFLESPGPIERSILSEHGEVICANARSADDIPSDLWKRAKAILAYDRLQFTARTLANLTQCRILVRVGVGTDNVDVAAARKQGLIVSNIPDYGTEEVADHTMAMMLCGLRGLLHSQSRLLSGQFERQNPQVRRLRGLRLGLVGLGRIGTAVARRARPFGLRIGFYDPYLNRGIEKAMDLERFEHLLELASQCDIVSLHVPLTHETQGMIDEEFFSHAKKQMHLINSARGGLIDLTALEKAMLQGVVQASGLDVFPKEPPPRNEFPLESGPLAPRLCLTPHVAFYSEQAQFEMREKAALEVKRVLSGYPPFYQVHPND